MWLSWLLRYAYKQDHHHTSLRERTHVSCDHTYACNYVHTLCAWALEVKHLPGRDNFQLYDSVASLADVLNFVITCFVGILRTRWHTDTSKHLHRERFDLCLCARTHARAGTLTRACLHKRTNSNYYVHTSSDTRTIACTHSCFPEFLSEILNIKSLTRKLCSSVFI